jgi:hypothetical protein
MELLLLLFVIVAVVAGLTGLVHDSRDYADWRPSKNGFRDSPRCG